MKNIILDNKVGINELYEREKNDEGEPKNDDTEEIKNIRPLNHLGKNYELIKDLNENENNDENNDENKLYYLMRVYYG